MILLEGAVNEREKIALQIKFGKRLSEIRKIRNFTQEDLSEEIHADRTYISYLERGKRNPSLYMLHKIASVLKVSLAELLNF